MAIKTGNGSDNEIFGTDSADILSGGGGNDTLSPRGIFLEPPTSTAFDHVYGGDGNADLLILDCRGESAAVSGGGGLDLWIGNYTGTASNVFLPVDTTHVVRAIGLMDFFGIERIDLVTGSGNDTIAGGAYVDNIGTGAGNDILNPGAKPVGAFENVDGGAGIDTFVVDVETETLPVTLGVAGSPNFIVTSVSDRYGASAYNCERVIFRGGAGDDVLTGGAGQDDFDFDVAADSPTAQADVIHDFLAGTDKINLSGLDANGTLPGEPKFLFIRNQPFHGIAGELRADLGTVQVDFDGDGRADFQINFANGGPAGLDDFIL